MRHTVAYLNRPTRDGRTVTDLRVGDDGPWPILWDGQCVGHVDLVEVDADVVWVEPVFDVPEPDWSLWCMALDMKNVDVHMIGVGMKMTGEFAAVTVARRYDWAWA